MSGIPIALLLDEGELDGLLAQARVEDRDPAAVLAERLVAAELPGALAEAAAALLAEGAEAERRLAAEQRGLPEGGT